MSIAGERQFIDMVRRRSEEQFDNCSTIKRRLSHYACKQNDKHRLSANQ
jgi:hypothetical protein